MLFFPYMIHRLSCHTLIWTYVAPYSHFDANTLVCLAAQLLLFDANTFVLDSILAVFFFAACTPFSLAFSWDLLGGARRVICCFRTGFHTWRVTYHGSYNGWTHWPPNSNLANLVIYGVFIRKSTFCHINRHPKQHILVDTVFNYRFHFALPGKCLWKNPENTPLGAGSTGARKVCVEDLKKNPGSPKWNL